ncbi:hypothetical protein ID866_9942 [Astraeus odoratus]|nr:hypothetical protein ID866_9942 [Astraeus odoratus]
MKHHLHLHFEILDMRLVIKYLGIQFERDLTTRELWLHQGDYIIHLLSKYSLSDCHPDGPQPSFPA